MLGKHQAIDRILLGTLLGHEVRIGTHVGQSNADHLLEIPHQHRHFSGSVKLDQPVVADRGGIDVAGRENRQVRHIADRAIGKMRPGDQLQLRTGGVQRLLPGQNLQLDDPLGRLVDTGPFEDPLPEHPEGGLGTAEPATTNVRHPIGGLGQDQAGIGILRTRAAAEDLAGQCHTIQFRLVTTQAEPEAVLALRGTVTGSLVATAS